MALELALDHQDLCLGQQDLCLGQQDQDQDQEVGFANILSKISSRVLNIPRQC